MYYPYLYFIYNTKTHEYYIGYRQRNVKLKLTAEQDFRTVYFTSSKKVEKRLYTNPAEWIHILYEHENAHLLYEIEQHLIYENIHDPKCLNERCRINGKYLYSDEAKKKISIKSKAFWNTPTASKLRTDANNRLWADPAYRKKQSIAHIGHKDTEETKERKRIANIERYKDPAERERTSEAMKKAYKVYEVGCMNCREIVSSRNIGQHYLSRKCLTSSK